MKKFILITMALLLGLSLLTFKFYKEDSIEEVPTNNIKQSGMLSMMLETESGSGNYEMTTLNSWPTDEYVFNNELSKCENGSVLSWDETNKQVVFSGNISDKCYAYFDKYNLITINNSSITLNGNKITITINAISGTGTISKYYYSKDDGVTYIESTSSSYVFTNLNKGTYNVKAYVEDSNGKRSKIISKIIEINSIPLIDYIMSQYNGTQGNNGIYYHDSSLTNGASDNSYRYAGANPNNYVCFGSTESSCPEDNLYRIIGVFEENNHGVKGQKLVKIIKSKSNGTSSWNDTESNNWASATLNTKLNTTFLTSNIAGYEDKIETVIYKVSGYSNADVTSKTFYDTEITNATKTVTSKIGLMYASDYGFATNNNYWTINLSTYSSEAKNEDWLYLGTIEWTLSPNPVSMPEGAITINGGAISVNYYSVQYYYDYRPAFYLVSDIQYVSGSGTSTDSIMIE